MEKQAPSVGRILAMVLFTLSVFGLLLFIWLSFGGTIPLKPKGYRFTAQFDQAAGLAEQADVRISGVRVGSVQEISQAENGNTDVLMQIDAKYAPIPSNVRSILRQKTLLGETYVEITPGDGDAKPLQDGGRLAPGATDESVQLDEIFRAFNEPTREAFQVWMQTAAAGYAGRAQDISDTLGTLPQFAADADKLLEILNGQEGAVRRLIRDTGVVFSAINQQSGALQGLIRNGNTVFRTLADRDNRLQELFIVLPTFLREGRQTVDQLTAFAENTNPLVDQLKPAARELSPTLIDLRDLSPDLLALLRDLGPVITLSRTGLPALDEILNQTRPVLGQLDPFLRNLVPVVDFLGLYTREINAFLASVPASTQYVSEAGGGPAHLLRTTNPLAVESLALYTKRIPNNRPNPYVLPGGFDLLRTGLRAYETRQCTGGATPVLSQTPIPFLDDPLATIPGETLRQLLNEFVFVNPGATPAPRCTQQPDFNLDGRRTRYPQVRAERPD
jgi:phospholipid/cholesterol/gamma-HCH transport system substrate-binding protein